MGDYEKLISRKDVDRFEEGPTYMYIISNLFIQLSLMCLASKQLQQVSLRLVKESFGDAMYNKALSCIKQLREEAIKVST